MLAGDESCPEPLFLSATLFLSKTALMLRVILSAGMQSSSITCADEVAVTFTDGNLAEKNKRLVLRKEQYEQRFGQMHIID